MELCVALMMQTYALKKENQDTVGAQFTWMTQELTWKVPFKKKVKEHTTTETETYLKLQKMLEGKKQQSKVTGSPKKNMQLQILITICRCQASMTTLAGKKIVVPFVDVSRQS